MVKCIKDNGRVVKNMEKGSTHGRMETAIKVGINLTNVRVSESCDIKTVRVIKGSG